MSQDLTFYTNPMSRGRIVRWMLEEVGCHYETEVLEGDGAMKAPSYLEINPMGKVPAIKHGSTVVTECAAICAYLADAFPDAGLAPALDARGAYYRWLFFAAGPVEAAVMNNALGFKAPVEKEKTVGYGTLEAVRHALIGAVDGDGYIAGEAFSAADVYVGSQIGWGMQFKTIEAHPTLEAYWAKVSDREAYRRATEIDNALLPAPPG